MSNSWDIKVNDQREADTIETYIIFCEDQVDEPAYFRSFQDDNSNLKINIVPNQKASKLNLMAALKYCLDSEYIKCDKGNIVLRENLPHNIWCVYDRDFESENYEEVSEQKNLEFSTSISQAQAAGLNVAWSNDSFELWILLHFEDIPNMEFCHRNYVYERLTEILKNLPDKSDDFNKITSNDSFHYKIHMKKKRTFIPYVLPLLEERQEDAIKRAIDLESRFEDNIHFYQRNPCTKVHLLVQELSK